MLQNCVKILIFSLLIIYSCKSISDGIVMEFDENGLVSISNNWEEIHRRKDEIVIRNPDIIYLEYFGFDHFERVHGKENVMRYYLSEILYDTKNNYEQNIHFYIVSIENNEYIIYVFSSLSNSRQGVVFATIAKNNNDKYYFKTRDGWGNIIEGNFYFYDNNIVLQMECVESIYKNNFVEGHFGHMMVLRNREYYGIE